MERKGASRPANNRHNGIKTNVKRQQTMSLKRSLVNGIEERKTSSPIKSSDIRNRAQHKQNDIFSIKYTTPTNVLEQKKIFFENDCKVNPRFEYYNYPMTLKCVQLQKGPSDKHLFIATKILDSFLATYGSESQYLETEGDVLT